ncbi:MAG: hypothetical protein ACRD3E_12710 [Terriglobales bacterium]
MRLLHGLLFRALAICVALAVLCGCTLLEQRRADNERTAVSTVMQVNTALYKFRQAHPDSYPKSLAEVPGIDPLINCGQAECMKAGYRFKYELLPATSMGPHYAIQVRPNKYQNTGVRSFYSDESGMVRATNDDRAASVGDGPVS